jgi:hypothetical protein
MTLSDVRLHEQRAFTRTPNMWLQSGTRKPPGAVSPLLSKSDGALVVKRWGSDKLRSKKRPSHASDNGPRLKSLPSSGTKMLLFPPEKRSGSPYISTFGVSPFVKAVSWTKDSSGTIKYHDDERLRGDRNPGTGVGGAGSGLMAVRYKGACPKATSEAAMASGQANLVLESLSATVENGFRNAAHYFSNNPQVHDCDAASSSQPRFCGAHSLDADGNISQNASTVTKHFPLDTGGVLWSPHTDDSLMLPPNAIPAHFDVLGTGFQLSLRQLRPGDLPDLHKSLRQVSAFTEICPHAIPLREGKRGQGQGRITIRMPHSLAMPGTDGESDNDGGGDLASLGSGFRVPEGAQVLALRDDCCKGSSGPARSRPTGQSFL